MTARGALLALAVLAFAVLAFDPRARAATIPIDLEAERIEQVVSGVPVRIGLTARLDLLDEEDVEPRATLSATLDLADLQTRMPAIVRAQGNHAERCGERVDLRAIALRPQEPQAALFVGGRFERWACLPVGAANPFLLFGQDGSINLALVPRVAAGGVQIGVEVQTVRADGGLGAILDLRWVGDWLRARLARSLARLFAPDALRFALPKALDALHPRFERVRFVDLGGERLGLLAQGDLTLSERQLERLLDQP